MVKNIAALIPTLSVLNSIGASNRARKKAAAQVARASCSGAGHSTGYMKSIFEKTSVAMFHEKTLFFIV